MYDPKAVSPMEDYRRRNAKAAKLESKQADLQRKRDAIRDEMRSVSDSGVKLAKMEELRGIRFDLDQLHAEILEVWESRYWRIP